MPGASKDAIYDALAGSRISRSMAKQSGARAIKKPSSPACSWIVSFNTAYLHTSFFRVILYSISFNMVVFSKITAALACISAASAVPMGGARKSSFTVKQLARPVASIKSLNLPGMYANALSKYGADVPASVKAAADSGSATTTPENNDVEYLTPVKIGGTTLNLDFDTGSADL
jgi:hypothetical protein